MKLLCRTNYICDILDGIYSQSPPFCSGNLYTCCFGWKRATIAKICPRLSLCILSAFSLQTPDYFLFAQDFFCWVSYLKAHCQGFHLAFYLWIFSGSHRTMLWHETMKFNIVFVFTTYIVNFGRCKVCSITEEIEICRILATFKIDTILNIFICLAYCWKYFFLMTSRSRPLTL